MNIESTSNGLGGQSMLLLWLACQKKIPATVSITADTGSEEDRQLQDGTRISAKEFFDKHVKPMANRHGVEAYFVRSVYKDGSEFPPLHEQMVTGGLQAQNVPMYGSEGGQLRQTCTDKWKLRAMRQCLRRLGAKTARSAIGIHWEEATRRVKGLHIGKFQHGDMDYNLYQTQDGRKEPKTIRWLKHYYPLVDFRLGRQAVRDTLAKQGIPYLISSECDHCPHQDDARWLAHTHETLERVAKMEEVYQGEFFFTDKRIPLMQAIDDMRRNPRPAKDDFGCKSGGLCGI